MTNTFTLLLSIVMVALITAQSPISQGILQSSSLVSNLSNAVQQIPNEDIVEETGNKLKDLLGKFKPKNKVNELNEVSSSTASNKASVQYETMDTTPKFLDPVSSSASTVNIVDRTSSSSSYKDVPCFYALFSTLLLSLMHVL